VGTYPEIECYGADYLSGDERAQFLAWYGEQKDNIFRNREELLDYCMGDVDVLRHAARLKFVFVQDGPHSAISHNIVHLQKVFRTMFLNSDTVGIIPRGSYRV
jgi:hypothetical protein